MLEDRNTREIELLFTREGMKVRQKVEGFFQEGPRWIDLEFHSYEEIQRINGIKLTVDRIDPMIEGDNLKCLRFHVTDYSRTPSPDSQQLDQGNEIEGDGIEGDGIMIQREFFQCGHQYEILVNTADWLIDHAGLSENDVPMERGYKYYLINSNPIHKDGSKFRSPKKLKNGMYIETKSGLDDTVNYAKKLLRHFKYSESDLRVIGFRSRTRRKVRQRN
jgi:hypothetical protein